MRAQEGDAAQDKAVLLNFKASIVEDPRGRLHEGTQALVHLCVANTRVSLQRQRFVLVGMQMRPRVEQPLCLGRRDP